MRSYLTVTAVALALGLASSAHAQTLAPQERLCDPTAEDCRADILTYIQQETQQIDMGFWMMSDARYSNALIAARNRGVRIRVLMDPRCSSSHPACVPPMNQLAAEGIPMRNRVAGGILHWKMILFASQEQVEFSGANYVPFETTPHEPWVNFTDEIIYFSNDPAVVRSMMTRFDDLWTSPTEFADYANITAPLTRSYPIYPLDPELNFPPDDSYRWRAVQAYDAEPQKIDVLMFRITDLNHTRAMLRAIDRGLPVRLITDTDEYRNPNRLWHAYNVDILHHAGVRVRLDAHQGINHAKGVLLYGAGLSIFGSSNWTSPSSDSQREHNYFTTKPAVFSWLAALFDRKWNNSTGHAETKRSCRCRPTSRSLLHLRTRRHRRRPRPESCCSGMRGCGRISTTSTSGRRRIPPRWRRTRNWAPASTRPTTAGLPSTSPCSRGLGYYWKIVSKTMAHVTADGPVWSFTTAGTAPNNTPPTVSITSPASGATFTAPESIALTASALDSDGTIAFVEFFAGSTSIGVDTAAPYSVTWTNVPAGTYHLTAVATDNGNASTTSDFLSITVNPGEPPPAGLPSGWSAADVGATGATGQSRFSGGTFTITGAGADVWGTADQFQYTYTTLTGDGSIVARVASTQFVHAWTKAGVMIRSSLSPSAAHAFQLVAASSAKGVPFQRRPADGAASVSTPGSQSTAPRWVKLVRAGSLITGYESADGVTWTTVGSDTFTMGSVVLIGLAVSSHVTGVSATATFDNVTVTPENPPPPPPN